MAVSKQSLNMSSHAKYDPDHPPSTLSDYQAMAAGYGITDPVGHKGHMVCGIALVCWDTSFLVHYDLSK